MQFYVIVAKMLMWQARVWQQCWRTEQDGCGERHKPTGPEGAGGDTEGGSDTEVG